MSLFSSLQLDLARAHPRKYKCEAVSTRRAGRFRRNQKLERLRKSMYLDKRILLPVVLGFILCAAGLAAPARKTSRKSLPPKASPPALRKVRTSPQARVVPGKRKTVRRYRRRPGLEFDVQPAASQMSRLIF